MCKAPSKKKKKQKTKQKQKKKKKKKNKKKQNKKKHKKTFWKMLKAQWSFSHRAGERTDRAMEARYPYLSFIIIIIYANIIILFVVFWNNKLSKWYLSYFLVVSCIYILYSREEMDSIRFKAYVECF